MVALALALTITVASLDLTIGGEVGSVFDVAFVVVCLLVALLVRPEDFFTVGVLPPLIMLSVIVLVAASRRSAVAEASDGMVQAVVSGLAQHAVALAVGYALCLACLGIRDRFLRAS